MQKKMAVRNNVVSSTNKQKNAINILEDDTKEIVDGQIS